MADKYIKIDNGQLQEVEATDTSTGVGEAGDIVALDSTGKIDNSLLPPGVGLETAQIEASQNLSAGDFVNIFDDAGTIKVRKADATTSGVEANGYVLDAWTSGQTATVYFEQVNNQITISGGGLTLYLSTTAGLVTSTPPSASGNIVQKLGRSYSTTEMTVNINQPIVLAV